MSLTVWDAQRTTLFGRGSVVHTVWGGAVEADWRDLIVAELALGAATRDLGVGRASRFLSFRSI